MTYGQAILITETKLMVSFIFTHMEKQTKRTRYEKPARQRCEVYSRVTGYLRPISQWNDGKQAEYDCRRTYTLKT